MYFDIPRGDARRPWLKASSRGRRRTRGSSRPASNELKEVILRQQMNRVSGRNVKIEGDGLNMPAHEIENRFETILSLYYLPGKKRH